MGHLTDRRVIHVHRADHTSPELSPTRISTVTPRLLGFHRFLGENPFGFAPLDIKSYYMGLTSCSWAETKSSRIRAEYQPAKPGSHNALADARAQAEMFEKMLASGTRSPHLREDA
jgi:hypothetical protein